MVNLSRRLLNHLQDPKTYSAYAEGSRRSLAGILEIL